ncbi:MAG: FAD-dependent oxidoreductase [Verrucomicrobiales bacterium]|nr:FAD-dependent oxidoreductase [Verrucomicrobiales bacterium]
MNRECSNRECSLCCLFLVFFSVVSRGEVTREVDADLLIVGATESGWAAAIQAARQGVESIVIVHDGKWFGGQYTEQSLACVDENKGMDNKGWGVPWHPMKRAFYRSGLFKELMDGIEAVNLEKYGEKLPGKPFHGPSTFRPAEAEAVFRELISPYIESGQIEVFWKRCPVSVAVEKSAVKNVTFAPVDLQSGITGDQDLTVTAKMTIDASDWGDVIQLSGAAWECGPDPASRYGEPSAPKAGTFPENEMNPITWAMIVEEADAESPISKPKRYDDRNFPRATHFSRAAFRDLKWDVPNPGAGSILHWPPDGKASARQLSVYSVRRIVDGYSSLDKKTSILLNYMNGQDYPLERLPRHVVEALEATETGASKKNIVEMTRPQRQIIFDDAKNHSLSVLYHLQNFVHERAEERQNSFRKFRLSSEFGTSDNLPPKPYIRESLRLKAMYVIREQDGRNRDGETKVSAVPGFSHVMYPDGLFPWQFHYDFHRTGRTYLVEEGDTGPWIDYHKKNRHTKFISDRCLFPVRSLIPEAVDGLLGAQGNVGFSSIVSAAVRLHDQRVHIGQAAGAVAAFSLSRGMAPRAIPYSEQALHEIRYSLCNSGDAMGIPLLLWPFRDLDPQHPAFEAVNHLSIRRILDFDRTHVDFLPDEVAEEGWMSAALQKAGLSVSPPDSQTRGEFCRWLWEEVKKLPMAEDRIPAGDTDGDGIPDREDALLFTPNEPVVFSITVPELTPETDGIPPDDFSTFFNFDTSMTGKFDSAKGYGWTKSLKQNVRRRNALDGPRDTFVFTRTEDVWECQLDSGTYEVIVCVGDSGHEQKYQRVEVEGKAIVKNRSTPAGGFIEAPATVKVADGRLSIKIGSGASSSNTCVNWVAINPVR